MSKTNLVAILCFAIVTLAQFDNVFAATLPNELRFFAIPNDPRIINGTEANQNATRHQVSIRSRLNDGYFFGTGHKCGGSLISNNVVLSAAHCFVDYTTSQPNGTFLPDKDFIVVMGNLDRFEYNNNTLVFDIIKVIKRVDIFNLNTFDDDIVLIMLNGTVPAKHPTIRPIILNDAPLPNNTMCQATGWGETEEGYPPDVLMSVDVPIIDFYDCRNKTQYRTSIHPGMLCAGYLEGERDACQGDSGGPLVCLGRQGGIISFGSGCAQPLLPGVYTDVAFYKQWILNTVIANNGTLPKFAPGVNNGGGENGGNNGGGENGENNGGGENGENNGGGENGENNGGGENGGNNGGGENGENNGGGENGENNGGGGNGENNGGGEDGGTNGGGDGVSGLSCSLALVSLMLAFNFIYSLLK